MNLVNNYLEQVKNYLSADADDDVIDELREAIEERVAEQQEISGGNADHQAVALILKDFGHPLKVASAYSKQQYLIGPGLFPLFKHALKLSVVAVFVIHAVLTVLTWTISENFLLSAKGWTSGFVEMVMFVVILVTMTFVSLEYYGEKIRFFDNWDPNKLGMESKIRASRQDGVSNVITDVIALIWWNNWFGLPNDMPFTVQDMHIQASEMFFVLYWPVNAILVCSLITYAWQLFSQFWTKPMIYTALLIDIAAILVLSLLLTQGHYVDLGQVENISINKFFGHINTVIKVAIFVVLGFVLYDLWRHIELWIALRKMQ